MVAVGLLNIPPEIQLQITEFVGTTKTLKALSVISRSLRSIAQSLLFKRFRIDLFKELRGSIDDLLANQQICAAIRVLEVGRFRLGSRLSIPHSTEERLSLIKRLLPELVGLRGVWIHQLNLNVTFMASVLEIAAKIPLKVKVGWNVYPSGISSMFNAPLRISHLHLGSIIDQPSLDFYRAVFRASAATLTELDMRSDGDGLMHLANIDLPCLHTLVLSLLIMTENKLSSTSAAAFITVQRTIRKLDLKGEVSLFPPLPPSALPDLRELHGSTELINQLVPGRPVEAIEIIAFRGSDQDWFGQEVAHSTARVRKLRVHLDAGMFNTQIVKRMVTVLPSLESLWLPVFHDTLLEVVEVVTSLKCLTHLRISLSRRDKTWINHDVGAIATKLRKANSCFSCIEIREGNASVWKDTISVWVWDEMFGAFHLCPCFEELAINYDSTSDWTTHMAI